MAPEVGGLGPALVDPPARPRPRPRRREELERALALLREKYRQYRVDPPTAPVLAVDVTEVRDWSADAGPFPRRTRLASRRWVAHGRSARAGERDHRGAPEEADGQP